MLTPFQKALLGVLAGGALVIALVLAAKSPAGAASPSLLSAPANAVVGLVPGQIPPGVVATGEGAAHARPDLAILSVGAVAQASTAADAQAQVAERIARILRRARQLGIAEKDIANAGYRVEPQYAYGRGEAPRLTGFQASQQLSLKLRKIEDAGKVLDAFVGEGATNASVRFALDDPKAAQAEARRLAVEDARAKAEAMARAAGVRLGRAISVTEVSAGLPPIRYREDVAAPKAATEIPVSDLEVVIRVQVQFALD